MRKTKTPCEQLDWRCGDLFVAGIGAADLPGVSLGQIVQLLSDDGTTVPFFSLAPGANIITAGGYSWGRYQVIDSAGFIEISNVEPLTFEDESHVEMYCMLYPSAEVYIRSQYDRQKQHEIA